MYVYCFSARVVDKKGPPYESSLFEKHHLSLHHREEENMRDYMIAQKSTSSSINSGQQRHEKRKTCFRARAKIILCVIDAHLFSVLHPQNQASIGVRGAVSHRIPANPEPFLPFSLGEGRLPPGYVSALRQSPFAVCSRPLCRDMIWSNVGSTS